MAIGLYLLLVMVGYAWGRGRVPAASVRALRRGTLALSGGGLLLYFGLSWAMGLLWFGQPVDVSIPRDLLTHGLPGRLALAGALLGAFAPIILTIYFNYAQGRQHGSGT